MSDWRRLKSILRNVESTIMYDLLLRERTIKVLLEVRGEADSGEKLEQAKSLRVSFYSELPIEDLIEIF